MKRFLADAILILILVGLGGYVQKQDEKVHSIEAEVEAFEDTIAQHKRITPKNTKVHLQDKEDNKASRMAKYGSAFVVDTLHGGVEVLSSLFDSLLN